MDNKQKTLLVLTVVAFGFLGYQIYRLVNEDIAETNIPVSAHITTTAAAVNPLHSETESRVRAVRISEPQIVRSLPKSLSANPLPIEKNQQEYLKLINRFQLVKMQRRLLDEEASIAAARNRIAILNHKTESLSGHSMRSAPVLVDDTVSGESRPKEQYKLTYVDKQSGKWGATLNNDGQYQEVTVGSELPDGAKVINIDRRGVTLQKAKKQILLTFNGNLVVHDNVAFAQNSKILVAPKAVTSSSNEQQNKEIALALQKTKKVDKTKTVSWKEAAVKNLTAKKLLANTATNPETTKALIESANKDGVASAAHVVTTQSLISAIQGEENEVVTPGKSLGGKKAQEAKANTAAAQPSKADQTSEFAPKPKPAKSEDKKKKHESKAKSIYSNKRRVSLAITDNVAANKQPDPEQTTPHHEKTDSAPPSKQLSYKYSPDELHLLHMKSNDYTIELAASYHQEIVNDFDRANELGRDALEYYVFNDGKRWHMLLYGDYKSLAAAQDAMMKLPPSLKMEGPWIRKVSDVQRDLRGRL